MIQEFQRNVWLTGGILNGYFTASAISILACWWCRKKGKDTNNSANLVSTRCQVPYKASANMAESHHQISEWKNAQIVTSLCYRSTPRVWEVSADALLSASLVASFSPGLSGPHCPLTPPEQMGQQTCSSQHFSWCDHWNFTEFQNFTLFINLRISTKDSLHSLK